MRIEIINWSKYNPRSDIKQTSWFRLENNFWSDPVLFDLDSDGKIVWMMLLGLASQRMSAQTLISTGMVSACLRVDEQKVNSILVELQDRKLIKILTSRKRNADVTKTSRGRHATNETNETNETNVCEGPSTPSPTKARKLKVVPDGSRVWDAYEAAYFLRYGQKPVRNAKTNGQCSQLVGRLGANVAIAVVRFFLTHDNRWYVQSIHALGCCLKDAEGLHTQMLGNHRISANGANHVDASLENRQNFAAVHEKLKAEGLL